MPDITLMGCSAEQTRVLGLGSLFLVGKLPIAERLALIIPDFHFQLPPSFSASSFSTFGR